MKATGIVRRIDDLGRVVIPKEIRRTMRIREGDPLEIFTDKDGELIFKKYSPIGELGDFAGQLCDSLRRSTDAIAAVCDRDAVIAIAGGARRELLEKPISQQLGEILEERALYRHSGGQRDQRQRGGRQVRRLRGGAGDLGGRCDGRGALRRPKGRAARRRDRVQAGPDGGRLPRQTDGELKKL